MADPCNWKFSGAEISAANSYHNISHRSSIWSLGPSGSGRRDMASRQMARVRRQNCFPEQRPPAGVYVCYRKRADPAGLSAFLGRPRSIRELRGPNGAPPIDGPCEATGEGLSEHRTAPAQPRTTRV